MGYCITKTFQKLEVFYYFTFLRQLNTDVESLFNFLFLKITLILMCALVPSPNAFLFTSQEFALVGDTADARYPAFVILQPDTFIEDTLCAHINMDAARQQEEAEIVQYEDPVPIVDPLSTAMQTYRYVSRNKKQRKFTVTCPCTTSSSKLQRPSLSVSTYGTFSNATQVSRLELRSRQF